MPIDAEVLEVDPPHRMQWRWVIDGAPTTVTITLRADGEATMLHLEHTDLLPDPRARFDTGWVDKFGDLATMLERSRMKVIHHVIDVDAPASKVWSAITEQSGLAGWWSTQVEASAATGRRARRVHLRRRLQPGDGDHEGSSPAPSSSGTAWAATIPGTTTRSAFELAPLDDGRTRLRFWQDYAVELSDDAYGIYNFNWGYYLESLRLLCTTGTGKPFDPAA